MSYNVDAVFAKFKKQLIQMGLELTEHNSNMYLLAGWLGSRGIAEPKVEDFFRATKSLKSELKWVDGKSPKKQGDVQSEKDTSRKNYADPDDKNWGVNESLVTNAARKMDADKAKKVLYEIEHGLIDGHRPYPHSKGNKERGQLTARFNSLVENSKKPITQEQAENIRTELKNMQKAWQ